MKFIHSQETLEIPEGGKLLDNRFPPVTFRRDRRL